MPAGLASPTGLAANGAKLPSVGTTHWLMFEALVTLKAYGSASPAAYGLAARSRAVSVRLPATSMPVTSLPAMVARRLPWAVVPSAAVKIVCSRYLPLAVTGTLTSSSTVRDSPAGRLAMSTVFEANFWLAASVSAPFSAVSSWLVMVTESLCVAPASAVKSAAACGAQT